VLANIGSDYLLILFTIKGKRELVPLNRLKVASTYFNTKLVDWKLFSDYLVKITKESTILASSSPTFTRLGLKLDEEVQNYLESISSELVLLVQLVANKVSESIEEGITTLRVDHPRMWGSGGRTEAGQLKGRVKP
jgi:hypothetical protein